MKNVVGSLVIAAALTILVITSMRSNTFRSVPVSQLRAADASPRPFVGQRLRVVGFVAADPVRKEPMQTPNGVVDVNHFKVEERGATLAVEYRDALPDLFKPGGPVQVDGVYEAPGVMKADHVLTKCPSKYESDKKYSAPKTAQATGDKAALKPY